MIGFVSLIVLSVLIMGLMGCIAAWGALGALWFFLGLAATAGFFYFIYRIIGNYNYSR